MIYMIDLTASCTFAVFCTLIKKRWNNAFFVPSVQGQVRDGISSDNNGMQVDGLIDGGAFGARQLVNLREPRPGKPTLGLLYRVGVFSAREGHETRGFLG